MYIRLELQFTQKILTILQPLDHGRWVVGVEGLVEIFNCDLLGFSALLLAFPTIDVVDLGICLVENDLGLITEVQLGSR